MLKIVGCGPSGAMTASSCSTVAVSQSWSQPSCTARLRYRVRYINPDGDERSKSFPDRQKGRADDFLIEVESDKREGKYIDPKGVQDLRQQAENWYKAQSPDPATREVLRSRLKRRDLSNPWRQAPRAY